MDQDVAAAPPTHWSQPSTPRPNNSDRAIGAHVAKLLLHYWVGDMSDQARAAMAADWVEDLREFGPTVVEAACARWRRSESRRPTPADIRRFAIEERQDHARPDLTALPSPDWRRRLVEQRAAKEEADQKEGHELADAWARQRDFHDFDAYLATGGSYADAIRAMIGTASGGHHGR